MFTPDEIPVTVDPSSILTWTVEQFRQLERALKSVGKRQAYQPLWTTFGGAATIGNGTLVGAFVEIGSFVIASIQLKIGSTTSISGSTFFFSLPRLPVKATPLWQGPARMSDNSAGTNFVGVVSTNAVLTDNSVFITTDTGIVAATVPFTWATDDMLRFTIGYALE